MSTPDPISAYLRRLRSSGPSSDPIRARLEGAIENLYGQQSRFGTFDDPVSQFLAGNSLQQIDAMTRIEAPARGGAFFFGQGAAGGSIHPIRALMGELEGQQEPEGVGETVAQGLGYLTGAMASFIPYYKVATTGLKVAGLARVAAYGGGRVGLSRGTHAAAGTIAGGMFEFGAGPMDDPREIGERVAIGTAFGLGGELAILGAARAWRARFPRTSGSTITPGPVAGDPNDLNPIALSVERQLFPASAVDEGELGARLAAFGNHEKQLELAAMDFAMYRDPTAPVIIPLPEDPTPLVKYLKQHSRAPLRIRRADDGWQVLVGPSERRTRLVPGGGPEVQPVFLGEGKAMSPEAMADVIRNGSPWFAPKLEEGKVRLWTNFGQGGAPINRVAAEVQEVTIMGNKAHARTYVDIPADWWAKNKESFPPMWEGQGRSITHILERRGLAKDIDVKIGTLIEPGIPLQFTQSLPPNVGGQYSRFGRGIRVRADMTPDETIGTMVHEYAHAVAHRMEDFYGIIPQYTDQLADLPNTWSGVALRTRENLDAYFGRYFQGNPAYSAEQLHKEMVYATGQILYRQDKGGFAKNAKIVADTLGGTKNVQYFGSSTELIARAAEWMLRASRNQLMNETPLLVTAMTGMIDDMSHRGLRTLLSKQQHLLNVDDLIKRLWIREGTNYKFLQQRHFQPTPSQLDDFQKYGLARGWEVSHGGKTWTIEQLTPGRKGLEKGQIRLRDIESDATKVVPRSEVSQPTLGALIEKDAALVARVKSALEARPGQVSIIRAAELESGKPTPPANEDAVLGIKLQRGNEQGLISLNPKVGVVDRIWSVEKGWHDAPGGKWRVLSLGEDGKPRGYTTHKTLAEAQAAAKDSKWLLGEVTMRPEKAASRSLNATRSGLINLKNFDFAKSLDDWVTTNRALYVAPVGDVPRANLPGQLRASEKRVAEVLRANGKDGIVFQNEGTTSVWVVNSKAISDGAEYAPGFARELTPARETTHLGVNNQPTPNGTLYDIPWETYARDVLDEAGALPHEIDRLISINSYRDQMLKVADPQMVEMERAAAATVNSQATSPQQVAAAADMQLDLLNDGRVRVLEAEGGREVAVLASMDDAAEYAAKVGPDLSAPVLDASSPVPTNVMKSSLVTGAAEPPKMQQLPDLDGPLAPGQTRWSKFIDRVNSFASMATGMETLARSFEKRGFGPAFSKVFDPLQRAWRQVDLEIARTKRTELGGKTFQEYFHNIEKGLLRSMTRDQKQDVVRYIEALSREEVERAGGLMQRAMTAKELDIAKEIVDLGLGREMPRLMALNQTIRNYTSNQEKFLRKATQQLKDPDVSPEFKETLTRLIRDADKMKDPIDVMSFLNLTAEEVRAIGLIRGTFGQSKDEVSIYAISRWAGAENLKPGFKTMRDQFAKERGLNGAQIQAANQLETAYKLAFKEAGLDARRELSGYWPHMRELSKFGFDPATDFIREVIPESTNWSALRFRSGELDVYSLDPASTSFRYIRGLYMHQHLDPILPGVKAAQKQVAALDERAGRILREYVMEVTGHPHQSFERLSGAIRSLFPGMPNDVGEKLINTLTALTYGATIPFRPALILRNAYQMPQTIPGKVGWGSFYDGMRIALTKEGWAEAVKAGAIPANVKPIFESSQILDPGKTFLPQRFRDIMETGFDWYRSPDDLGRAVAYHAQKARIAKHEGRLQRGEISYEQFKQAAKVNTYDPLDIQAFDKLWQDGHYAQAKEILGRSFAYETHFRYGHANHPAGWGSVYGRLFGQFGTWPVQYKDFVLQGLSRGSGRDKFEFAMNQAIVNGGIVAAGAAVGVNLQNWVIFPSLQYTGGPYAGMTVDLIQAMSGSPQERALAQRSLSYMFPTLDNPQSIFIPGSYAVGDLVKAFESDGLGEGIMRAGGFRMYDADDTRSVTEKTWDFFFDF